MADADVGDEALVFFFDYVEGDALALAEEAKHAAFQRTGAKVDLVSFGIKDDDAGLGAGVVCLDDALHDGRLGLLDLAGFEAGGADTNSFGVGSVPDAYTLDIGGPATVGTLVREGDLPAEARFFVADFTAIGHQ